MVAGVTASDTSSTERLSSPGKYCKTNSIKDGSSVCDTLGPLAFAIYHLISLRFVTALRFTESRLTESRLLEPLVTTFLRVTRTPLLTF